MAETKNRSEDEISLKDLILKIQDYIRYFWKKKWWLVLAGLIGAAIFVYRGMRKPEVYEGTLTFVVNEDKGSGGGVGSILGQIGLGGSTDEQGTGRIIALSESRSIIYDMLLDSVEIDGKADIIGNHLIEVHNFRESFAKYAPYLATFAFEQGRLEDFSRQDYSILKQLHYYITLKSDPILTIDHNEDNGIFTLTAFGQSEGLTISLLNGMYQKLNEFYVRTSVGGQERTLAELNVRADSVAIELSRVEYNLANVEDRSLGLLNRSDLVRQQQLQREAALLNGLYIEVLRNKEAAEFILKTNRPQFEIVDDPAYPLGSLGTPMERSAIIGVIFGGFLMGIVLLLIKAYRDVMASD